MTSKDKQDKLRTAADKVCNHDPEKIFGGLEGLEQLKHQFPIVATALGALLKDIADLSEVLERTK